jgi:hypothetical protein
MIASPHIPPFSYNRLLMRATVFAVIVAAASVYAPRLNDFFLSDDFHYLRACEESAAFGADDPWYAVTIGQLDFHFRPVFGLTGWIIHSLFGLEPFWHHLANLILHLTAVWLTILLVRRFVTSHWTAIGAGALFALHFVNAEPVVWISARTSLLVTVFMLSAIVLETSQRRRLWGPGRWVALLLAVLAHLSKEHAVALPLLLLLVPEQPIDLDESRQSAPRRPLRTFGTALWRRIVHFWPYVALTAVFITVRFGAIIASTQTLYYRLEFHANVLKNLAFVCVSSLFPLDFRAALHAWNRWYLDGQADALVEFILGYPGVLVGTFVAVVIWISIFLWGHRAAKRLAAWVFIAALPVLFFRGAGERLMYLSVAGMAGSIAVILAVWHRSFVAVFRHIGRWISPAMALLIIALNIGWLRERLRDWQTAGELSRTIVSALAEAATEMPSGASVRFNGAPDNVNGAWVFRLGIDDAFALYAGRPDVRAVPARAFENDPAVLTYVWTGERFQLTSAATPDAHTIPQSAEP